MSLGSVEDVEGLRRAGRVVAAAIEAMRAAVRPEITTPELDAIVITETEPRIVMAA